MRLTVSALAALLCASCAFAQSDAVNASWDLIHKGLEDKSADKRKQALTAVGVIGTLPAAVEILEKEMTSQDDSDVRGVAASMLGDMKSTGSIPKLKKAVEDDPDISFSAARALWNMGDHSGMELLQNVVMAEQAKSQSAVADAKRDAKRKLHDPGYLAKTGAEQAAEALFGPFSVGLKLATELRKDSSAASRLLSINLISQDCNAKGTVEAIESAASHDKNDGVRAGAARALAVCGGRRSLEKLQPLLVYDKYAVQLVAAAAIIRIESRVK